MMRYVVRGTVRDTEGNPVEGAAVAVGGEVVYTNSSGEFFLRARYPRRLTLKILADEFLLPGQWEPVTVPGEVIAADESRAEAVRIILRRAQRSVDVQ
jgi:hypothetical protein